MGAIHKPEVRERTAEILESGQAACEMHGHKDG